MPRLLRLLLRGKGDEGPRGALLLRVGVVTVPFVLPISSFPSYSPCTPTHPFHPDVCIVALPDGLIVVFVSFRPSPPAPSALRPVFRCAVRGTAGSLASSSNRLIVMSNVM